MLKFAIFRKFYNSRKNRVFVVKTCPFVSKIVKMFC